MILAVVQIRHQELQRVCGNPFGRRNFGQDGLEERLEVFGAVVERTFSDAAPGNRVEDGEVELVLRGIEIDKQVVDFVEHFLRACVRTVDLVDHNDRWQFGFERLTKDVTRLGKRALTCVDEQQNAVHQPEGALHLTSKIAVAGRIDDVDADAFVRNRGVLGQDGNSALALEFVRVHDALNHLLVRFEDTALP